MEFVLIWTACAVVCAIVANAKNRNVLGWFIGGFLLGFFAVLVLAFMKSLPDAASVALSGNAVAPAALVTHEGKNCPFCREIIRKDALLCKHCGSKIEV